MTNLPAPPATTMRFLVRADLVGANPPIWRRLTLPGDLTLDQVHDALQVALGWTNSHLHGFSPTDDRFSDGPVRILTQFDLDEGDEGVLETEVRLDQLIEQPGDSFFYLYDYGDNWQHKVVVESVDPLEAGDHRIRCLDGHRTAPPEDSGGIHWYQHLREVAADPRHPEHYDLRENFGWLPPESEPDLDAVNRGLARLEGAATTLAWLRGQTTPLATLVRTLGQEAQLHTAGFVSDAALTEPVEVSEAEATRATAVFATYLRHVRGGVRLTAAGYLPPATVAALMKELDPEQRWIGTATREIQTAPLLYLREAMTLLGLVRKYRGELVATKQGARLADSPVELWNYLAARLPAEKSDTARDVGLLLLLLVAAGEGRFGRQIEGVLDEMTAMIGVEVSGGNPYLPAALSVVWDTRKVLEWVGSGKLLARSNDHTALASPTSRLLARAALATP